MNGSAWQRGSKSQKPEARESRGPKGRAGCIHGWSWPKSKRASFFVRPMAARPGGALRPSGPISGAPVTLEVSEWLITAPEICASGQSSRPPPSTTGRCRPRRRTTGAGRMPASFRNSIHSYCGRWNLLQRDYSSSAPGPWNVHLFQQCCT